MNNLLTEMKNTSIEMKKSMEIDWMLNQYEKTRQGELTWKQQVSAVWSKTLAALSTSWRDYLKRLLDLTSSLIGCIIASPVMLIIAAVIKATSKGPVLYSQVRVGKHGKFFKMYKFRSMRQDAETKSGPVWATENDPRVTPVGAFLRTSHLDELPQLFNVIRGEMSLVGPRPERPYFVEEFSKTIPHYKKRLEAKPGVTGLAQIKRRYDETLADVKNKVRYDRLYIEKMCPFLDVKVLLLTVGTVIFKTGR